MVSRACAATTHKNGKPSFFILIIFHLRNNVLEYIFYSNPTHISYISVDGGESTAILSVQSATLGYDQLEYRLWYFETISVTLHNSNLDASDPKTVAVPSNFGPFTVDAVNRSIYYLNKDDYSVKSMDYDGKHHPKNTVLQTAEDFEDIQIDSSNR